MSESISLRAEAGRVEKVLVRALGRSRDHVAKLLRQERVWLEGPRARPLKRGERLVGGESLSVRPAPEGERAPPQPNRRLRLRLLAEDEALIVVDKDAGLPTHPGPGHSNDTLLNALVGRFPELLKLGPKREYGLVHRLDLGTSGVLVVARTPEAYDPLVAAFAGREVAKRYRALVRGAPAEAEGVVTTPVHDKPAHTSYRLLETRGAASLLELQPRTGRTHQVRIHLAELGCPVLGDEQYGSGRDEITARLYLTRMALHAEELSLSHPLSGERLTWTSAWPAALRKAWKRCAER